MNDNFYQQRLDEIFQENDIRFAGFIDSKGSLIRGKFREDIVPFETNDEQQKIFRELAYRVATRKNFDYSMGPVKYSASRREKLVMMSFPLKKNILLITTEPNVNIDRLAYKILQILEK
ncbi:DUF6659 family protein [Nitrosarchaeum koreense]|uniref:Roadblock/LC7 family protein n=1 Tax=Nitrosarchaeum koreense MY1 TaxID=1001994 RepID=F9CY33_9ARCH|nr:DUF6659 family protein [Nitrosarchaeum koreense]EGP94388.1 hypothetical protein MY1_1639 [Nitrosarchaeum koreense MY1]